MFELSEAIKEPLYYIARVTGGNLLISTMIVNEYDCTRINIEIHYANVFTSGFFNYWDAGSFSVIIPRPLEAYKSKL